MEYGLIGEKVGHSFSALIHSKIGRYRYELKEIAPENLEDFIKSRNYKGLNVTIPYKSAVIPFLDEIDESAKKIGAVNTVVNRHNRLIGYNTDYYGFLSLIKKANFDLNGKTVLILGTGGTSKTVKAALESLNAKCIIKVSRNGKNEGEISYKTATEEYKHADFIINTTPVGMYPDIQKSPVDISSFNHLSGVIDVIYNPLRTELLLNAKEKNIKTAGGLYMLVAQAVKSAYYFTGDIEIENMAKEIYRSVIREKENAVLIGMPGCGKSTVGNILKDTLLRQFYDTDAETEKNEGRTIPEIFKENGEEYFRNSEANAVKDLSSKNGIIIATGGGVIKRAENIKNLRRNGKIFFLDKPLDMIIPTSSRPLSSTVQDLEKLYFERYGLYKKYSDKIINCKDGSIIAAKNISEDFI